MDEISAGSEIGGASKGGEVETDEIGDVGLGCRQLRVSGCEAEGKDVCIISVFVCGIKNPKVLTCKLPSPFINLGADKVLG